MNNRNNPNIDRRPLATPNTERGRSVQNIEDALEREVRLRRAKVRKVSGVLDRVFGFMLVTALAVLVGGLGLVYVFTKGPSPALRDNFVMTMSQTRRFDFMGNLFLTDEELAEIRAVGDVEEIEEFDASLITVNSAAAAEDVEESPYPKDEDGDGVIFEKVKGPGYVGYMLTIMDPKRVFIGMPDSYGGVGLLLEEFVAKYGAIGGINGGGFKDDGGTGNGGVPEGLTIVDGVIYGDTNGESAFCGFDADGIMHVGYYSAWLAEQKNIVSGVSFGPLLLVNGEPALPAEFKNSGTNPRTAIGQRDDGAIMMLVIDGRQAHSLGASYEDCMELLLSRGAVNAINMDGGSSTTMYYNGEYVNRNSATYGKRTLPSAILFK